MKLLIILLVVAALLAGGAFFLFGGRPSPRPTVGQVDLERYMGTWYEIARFDHRFERGLTRVRAHYNLLPNGRIEVINSGYDPARQRWREARGKAHASDIAGRLRVSFFWIFYSDYDILALDPDYQWALVGSRSPHYLWILSRTPALSEQTLGHILHQANALGYPVDKLIMVDQQP